MSENVFGITDLGRQRKNNEDDFIAHPAADPRYVIACVIDCVGGYSGGEIAASITRESVSEHLGKLAGEVIPELIAAFTAANEKIWQEKHTTRQHNSMACVVTLAVADLASNQFYYAHLGDTRLYLLRDGSLVKISHDQSFTGFLEDSGRLTEQEAMKHPKRNEIDKALGFKEVISPVDDIETGQSPFLPGDMLLLCSDGLTDVVDKATITGIVTRDESLKSIGEALINAANDGGGKDNITVVLIKNDKEKQHHAATKPLENSKIQKQHMDKPKTVPSAPLAHGGETAKTYKGWAIFFFILVIGLAIACAVQFFNPAVPANGSSSPTDAVSPTQKPRNAQEIKLLEAIDNAKGRVLVLTDTAFRSPIILSRSIVIDKDSLQLKARGNITFQSDSTLKAPAFILSSKTKNILFDSVTFQNFGVAILGRDRALQLKNVKFKDCIIPLENSYVLNDNKYINGGLGTPVFKADTSPTKSK